jgi:hypothetical protein
LPIQGNLEPDDQW